MSDSVRRRRVHLLRLVRLVIAVEDRARGEKTKAGRAYLHGVSSGAKAAFALLRPMWQKSRE